MSLATKYIGLDVSKQKIAIAIAEEGRQDPRYWGSIPPHQGSRTKVGWASTLYSGCSIGSML